MLLLSVVEDETSMPPPELSAMVLFVTVIVMPSFSRPPLLPKEAELPATVHSAIVIVPMFWIAPPMLPELLEKVLSVTVMVPMFWMAPPPPPPNGKTRTALLLSKVQSATLRVPMLEMAPAMLARLLLKAQSVTVSVPLFRMAPPNSFEAIDGHRPVGEQDGAEADLSAAVHLEDSAGVVAIDRDPRRASVDGEARRGGRQAQFQLRPSQHDGAGHLGVVELDRIGPAGVECAADLPWISGLRLDRLGLLLRIEMASRSDR